MSCKNCNYGPMDSITQGVSWCPRCGALLRYGIECDDVWELPGPIRRKLVGHKGYCKTAPLQFSDPPCAISKPLQELMQKTVEESIRRYYKRLEEQAEAYIKLGYKVTDLTIVRHDDTSTDYVAQKDSVLDPSTRHGNG